LLKLKVMRLCAAEISPFNFLNRSLSFLIFALSILKIILLRDFKKFTATRILDLLQNSPESRREWILERLHKATFSHTRNKNYQVWQAGNHAEEIYSEKFLWSKLDYIHLNPVRSGFVAKASDYVYSSASNYIHGNGVLEEVTLADNPVADVLKSWTISRYNSY